MKTLSVAPSNRREDSITGLVVERTLTQFSRKPVTAVVVEIFGTARPGRAGFLRTRYANPAKKFGIEGCCRTQGGEDTLVPLSAKMNDGRRRLGEDVHDPGDRRGHIRSRVTRCATLPVVSLDTCL